MQILINIVLGLFILVAVVMILVILMQRPKSEGLGAAFGGGMTDNLFGAQTTNVLVKFTGWLAGLFFALTFLLSVLYAHYSIPVSGLRQELMKDQATTTALPSATPMRPLQVESPSTATNPAPADQAASTSAPAATPAASAAPSAQPSP